jgi:hypothetical protein
MRGVQKGHEPDTEKMMRLAYVLFIAATVAATSAAQSQEIDWQKVDDAMGRKLAVVSGDVHRYGFPRSDLSVTLDGVGIKPALALGGWVAFKAMSSGNQAMVMGDLVLLETEIKPVMTKLVEGGLDITAVHNHLLRANPAAKVKPTAASINSRWRAAMPSPRTQ